MKALLLDAERRTANVKSISDPRPAPNELLIRVKAVALNPVDSLYVFNPLALTGRVIGSDFAGVVDALGDAVPPTSGLKLGDRVAGFLQGACSINERPGAFSDYLVCPWDLVWKVGDGMRLQEAAAISLCGLTAAQALFFRFGLEAPFQWLETPAITAGPEKHRQEPPSTLSFFIYGASTSVGMYAAQLVRRSAGSSGRTIKLFGTAGQKHFNMLKAEPYCYTDVVDYHDDDWPAKVLSLTNGTGVDYAYDCISEGSTVSDTGKTLAPSGEMAIVRSREGGAWTARNLAVEPSYGAVWEGLGEDVQYQGMILPASQEARGFAVAFYKWLSEGGKLEPNPLREMPGGLESIVDDGLRLLGSGTMGDRDTKSEKDWMRPLSAEKMVYRIAVGLEVSIQ
jgi:NADPH:quinone reductase-like Zn-dependent oxidoreductase